MATLQQVEDHATVVDNLSTTAIAELLAVWATFDLEDAAVTRVNLEELLEAIIGSYGTIAQEIAADWYDSLRAYANVNQRYTATGIELPTVERIQSLTGWATEPLRKPDLAQPPETAEELALSRVAGGLQRVLGNIDRSMVETNAARDPADAKWARYASATACAFCAMLAARGPVYTSKRTATAASGQRGTQPLNERYHDWCKCIGVVVWPGDDYQEAPYVQQFREAYDAAAEAGGGTTEILAHMREHAGFR